MLALRLARGSHPLVLLRRLTVAAASAGVGFLLLSAMAHALAHPGESSASLLRLLWCAVPLAATVHLAVAVARTDPGTRPRPGLSAIGLGPARLTAIAATTTALSTALGSMVALLVFLHLRGDLTGLPFDDGAGRLLAAGVPLPVGAALTLLAVVPVVSSAAAALTLRPRRVRPGGETDPDRPAEPASAPTGLPWGVALIAAGLTAEVYTTPEATAAGGAASAPPLMLPGHFDGSPAGVLAGWTLTALGLALTGPGLTYRCGRLLQGVRPGPTRLLAGRILMEDARRIGRPLGVVCAVAAGGVAAWSLYAAGPRPFGPLTALGAALVVICTTATLFTAALESRTTRAGTAECLLEQGAPAGLLRSAAGLRAAVLLTVFAPLTWTVAMLAAFPLRH
ncbi:hypothetical protein [Streptomyces sp. MUM 178J]|uniref:hypothetical protein n=1 Tax=Streptomyces sp. MUM 178J TaxID=2791991 RepID=UPI001F04EBBF|nr:hypothetical protein [Streptomyces sp. MUM 178J]WRQ80972.1 hypothetical protein I3F59_017290 [Streptomyces sp. MUM 178J]